MLGPSSWLIQTAKRIPDKEALFDEQLSLSFENLHRNAHGMAKWLSCEGEVGQRIMIVMPSNVTSAILYFATMLAGRVAVPIDPSLRPERLESLREEIEPHWIFGTSTLKEVWSDSRVLIANAYVDLYQWMKPYERDEGLTLPDDNPSRLLNIVYTSGTTGRPKGVMLNGANLEAVIRGILRALDIKETDRIFSPLPFFHTYGLSQLWIMAKTGATLSVLSDITRMADIKRILWERNINTIVEVPYHFVMLTRRGEKEKMESITLVTVAGEASPRGLIEKIKATYPKARIYILYGLTESTTRLTTLPFEDLERKKDSIGLPIEGVELKIVNEEGQELGPFEEGELIAYGENITPGYWQNEDLTQRTIINGWLHTGDIVKRDEEGYYYHMGRKDFVFKSGGEKIIPEVIEKVLREIEGVRDAAVFGREDPLVGNRICAVVVKEEGSFTTLEEILSFCQLRLEPRWIPHEVLFTEEIPKSSNGKIRYDLLKSKFQNETG